MSTKQVINEVDFLKYYESELGYLTPVGAGTGQFLAKCPFHDDKTSSLSINTSRENAGIFYCHGCTKKGNIISFELFRYDKKSLKEAAVSILKKCNIEIKSAPNLTKARIEKYHLTLLKDLDLQKLLLNDRGITVNSVVEHVLGFDEESSRITIPVFDSDGKLVNIRKWLLPHLRKGVLGEKIIGEGGHNENRLFNIQALGSQEIVLCEGELDAILLKQYGYSPLTATAGVNSFNGNKWGPYFRDKDVILLHDNDTAGIEAGDKILDILYPYVRSIKQVWFPLTGEKEDITSFWFKHKDNFKEELDSLIKSAPEFIKLDLSDSTIKSINLFQCNKPEFINAKLKLTGVVAGKGDEVLSLPRCIQTTCGKLGEDDNCASCPFRKENGLINYVKPYDEKIIDLIRTSPAQQHRIFKEMTGVNCKNALFKVKEYQSVEKVILIPEVNLTEATIQSIYKEAYAVGFGFVPNEKYNFCGTAAVEPDTGNITNIYYSSEAASQQQDKFDIESEIYLGEQPVLVKEALKIFQPISGQTVMEKLQDIYSELEEHITKIVGRYDIIRAYDLNAHSALHFWLGEERIHKGWLDTLIIGDTRCGKSVTINKLKNHYGCGAVIDASNVSKVGLMGGYIAVGSNKRNNYLLGAFPLNHGKQLILDEVGDMPIEIWRDMTLMRDHGISESTKLAQTNRHAACVRFVALSNPRHRQSLSDYTYGIYAIRDIVGADADIARFDHVVVVGAKDIPFELINTLRGKIETELTYTSDLCNLLIRWAWSRNENNYNFTDEAIVYLFSNVNNVAIQYDDSIPIALPQEFRVKIAKLAVAIATRLFSTTTGEDVLITKQHMEAAFEIIEEDYSKPANGFINYSRVQKSQKTIVDISQVKRILDEADYQVYSAFLNANMFIKRDIVDSLGNLQIQVELVWQGLKRHNCILARGKFHVKSGEFNAFLRDYQHPNKNNDKPNLQQNGTPLDYNREDDDVFS